MPPDIQGKVKSMDGSGLGSVDVEVDGVSLIMILILPTTPPSALPSNLITVSE